MPGIASAAITAFYLFDVAEAITLADLPEAIRRFMSEARLVPTPAIPSYVGYQQPPRVLEGAAVGIEGPAGFTSRFKVYDYGIVSVALTRPFAGSWAELIAIGQQIVENEALEAQAEAACRALVERLTPVMVRPRRSFLTEDYVVFVVTALEERLSGSALLERFGEEIAMLLRGERHALSRQERQEVLRDSLSYFAHDLVVPTWNGALVYDTEAGAASALEILELANSQLLQYRYYDDLLDAELAGTYAKLQAPRWYDALAGRRFTRAARHLHQVYIEVNELTDRTENALKVVGDMYAARLFARVGARVGLDGWKASVEDKLKTLDGIYRFAVEQTGMRRGQFLEATIVLILILELALVLLGIMA